MTICGFTGDFVTDYFWLEVVTLFSLSWLLSNLVVTTRRQDCISGGSIDAEL